MSRNLYVTLPVKDVQRSVDFFAALGFAFNPKFASDNGAALVINDSTTVMLTTEAFFSTLTKVPIVDARQATEALFSLSLDSRAEVDDLIHKAVAAGAQEGHDPEDYGFMYQRAFIDLDGHQWGVFQMNAE
ncbi:MAG TPA: glyoxalase/bleomycin resistance/extradiol dioxygenase family protein [Thermomonas sp.]|jgi:predicted lactoylglutathione lyase|nr:glyoxalase/bleomycin resistance/extradiol dioxygenase family protein [Thermomonas sp.]HQY49764.1 glyoxalase/bleomycin resistance/extradiol dioxygenase family protein [Thermomonas sp.]HRA57655.1 glyoxalase/bleomycin resistance/extradiol dioxygenase family protein [Thermomonas sp.]